MLGGGGARGLANIGVLKSIEKHFGRGKLPVDMIIGTSIGSMIGAAYALGVPVEKLEEEALNFNWQKIADFGFKPTGFVKGDKFEKIIVDLVDSKSFEDMQIPFALVTTDVETGDEYVHTSGNLVRLIRASCSWPGIFSVVDIGGVLHADGGLRNSIPTKAAKNLGATFIIAVNPGFGIKSHKLSNALRALIQTVQIMGEELNDYQAASADVVIKPVMRDIDQFDFSKAAEIIKFGELAAEEKIHELKLKLVFHLA